VVLTTRLAAWAFPAATAKLAQEIFGAAEVMIGRPKLQSMTDEIPGLTPFLWPQNP